MKQKYCTQNVLIIICSPSVRLTGVGNVGMPGGLDSVAILGRSLHASHGEETKKKRHSSLRKGCRWTWISRVVLAVTSCCRERNFGTDGTT